MLVGPHDGRVDQHTFDLRRIRHRMRHALPHTFSTPPREEHVYRMPSSEFLRQIALWTAPLWTAHSADSENGFDKPAIVGRRSPLDRLPCLATLIGGVAENKKVR